MEALISAEGLYAGASRVVITSCYFGCFASVGFCLSALGPILLSLSHQVDVSLDTLGGLFVARSVGYLVGSIVSGFLVDRIRRTHLVLIVPMLLCAAGTGLVPVLSTFTLVAIAVSTQGFSMGVLDTGGNVLLIWLYGSANVEPFMQGMHFCFGLGGLARLTKSFSHLLSASPLESLPPIAHQARSSLLFSSSSPCSPPEASPSPSTPSP